MYSRLMSIEAAETGRQWAMARYASAERLLVLVIASRRESAPCWSKCRCMLSSIYARLFDTILIWLWSWKGQHECTISSLCDICWFDFTAAFFNTYRHLAYSGSECSAIHVLRIVLHTHTLCVTWACCRKSFSNTCVCSQLCLNKAAFSGLWMHYSARCVNCDASGYESVFREAATRSCSPCKQRLAFILHITKESK